MTILIPDTCLVFTNLRLSFHTLGLNLSRCSDTQGIEFDRLLI